MPVIDREVEKRLAENIAEIDKHLGAVQVQVDRLDSKISNFRRDQSQAQDSN